MREGRIAQEKKQSVPACPSYMAKNNKSCRDFRSYLHDAKEWKQIV